MLEAYQNFDFPKSSLTVRLMLKRADLLDCYSLSLAAIRRWTTVQNTNTRRDKQLAPSSYSPMSGGSRKVHPTQLGTCLREVNFLPNHSIGSLSDVLQVRVARTNIEQLASNHLDGTTHETNRTGTCGSRLRYGRRHSLSFSNSAPSLSVARTTGAERTESCCPPSWKQEKKSPLVQLKFHLRPKWLTPHRRPTKIKSLKCLVYACAFPSSDGFSVQSDKKAASWSYSFSILDQLMRLPTGYMLSFSRGRNCSLANLSQTAQYWAWRHFSSLAL